MTYYMMMKLALGFWTPKTKLRKTLYYNHWSSVVKLLVLHSFKAKPLPQQSQAAAGQQHQEFQDNPLKPY